MASNIELSRCHGKLQLGKCMGIPAATRGVSNEPKIIKIGPEMNIRKPA
jgi:hypothetical protein